ncbi:transcription initiation factor IIB family protein [Saliphagus infecundisoli]|uniref:Transcription initiation factor IIB family protein n=1 Tax=Saliphagus infecundisoli TaxID=1849069 RepID=A0ABD5QH91_9EURY|nr:transcription initiation factor IIB family protein [Saliphagus infecundisoli]
MSTTPTRFAQFDGSNEQESEHDDATTRSVTSTSTNTETETKSETTHSIRETGEREPAHQSTCVECGGRVITEDNTSHCQECGLVVTADHIDHGPTRRFHGPQSGGGPAEWSCESVTQLRIDKGLHTTFYLTSDGYGNALSSDQQDKYDRLKHRHKRFQVESKRAIRLNEALRDVQMIGGNLGLPSHVVVDAGRLVKEAGDARVPGAWTSWEGVAAGAVLLAATDAGVNRPVREVACYGKVSHVRLCAAARKIRCYVSTDVSPIRADAVATVLETLDKSAIDSGTYLRLKDVAQRLMEVADEEAIGAGTPRLTVAAAAVYAGDRLLGSECLTMQQVADSISVIVETSKDKINRYSSTLRTEYAERDEAATPSALPQYGRIVME